MISLLLVVERGFLSTGKWSGIEDERLGVLLLESPGRKDMGNGMEVVGNSRLGLTGQDRAGKQRLL